MKDGRPRLSTLSMIPRGVTARCTPMGTSTRTHWTEKGNNVFIPCHLDQISMQTLKEQEKMAQSVKQILRKVSTPHSNAHGYMHTRSEFWISIVLLYPDSFKEQRVLLFITTKEWLKMTSFCPVGELWGRGTCPQSAQEQISASSALYGHRIRKKHTHLLCANSI